MLKRFPQRDREPVKDIGRAFLQNTTLHGCSVIANHRNHVLRRSLWLTSLFLMIAALVYFLISYYTCYREYKVVTSMKIEQSSKLPFPAITICSSCGYSRRGLPKHEAVQEFLLKYSSLDYLSSFDSSDVGNQIANLTVREINNAGALPSDFISAVRWNQKTLAISEMEKNVTRLLTIAGHCFQLNSKRMANWTQLVSTRLGSMYGLEVTLHINRDDCSVMCHGTDGAKVVVHDPNDVPKVMTQAIAVPPQTAAYIRIRQKTYKFKPYPYKSYGNKYCKDTSPPKYPDDYSRERCVISLAAELTAEKCGCKGIIASEHLLQRDCTMAEASCHADTYRAYIDKFTMSDVPECPHPCSYTEYTTQVSYDHFPTEAGLDLMTTYTAKKQGILPSKRLKDKIRRNSAKVIVYFDTFETEHIVYTPETSNLEILSAVGGQMGLFVGASLLTILEVLETLMMIMWTFCERALRRLHHKP